jgi:hypothetical protein
MNTFWTVMASLAGALIGGLIAAVATIRATRSTITAQVKLSVAERAKTSSDNFEKAVDRAAEELATAVVAFGLTDEPTPPFFNLDHSALNGLLIYDDVPENVVLDAQRLALALRSYNAAALWGNAQTYESNIGNRVMVRWNDARTAAEALRVSFEIWRPDPPLRIHPLFD